MSVRVHEFSATVADLDGHTYRAAALGEQRRDGTWIGWLEFVPTSGGIVRHTPRETTQPNLEALVYWSRGLEVVYLEGALERAITAPIDALTSPSREPESPAS